MTSKHPHDQRFWETDEWECGWLKMTQMLLFYISAHLYVVFLEDDRTLEYLYLGSVACVRVEDEALRGMFVFTFIPHCVSTVFPNVSVSLASCWKTAACVCACAHVRLRGCWLYSRLLTLSDFVSGFLTHVLMAIKDFSLFGIHFFFLFNIYETNHIKLGCYVDASVLQCNN